MFSGERELQNRVRDRLSRVLGIRWNTPYPIAAPVTGGLAGDIGAYALGRKYDIPSYLTIPMGMYSGATMGTQINNLFEDRDKTASLRLLNTRLRIREALRRRGY
jgi:hypothetical protein